MAHLYHRRRRVVSRRVYGGGKRSTQAFCVLIPSVYSSPAGSTGPGVPGTDGTGGTSGCTTNPGFTGSVEATSVPPFFTSTLCPVGSTCCASGKYFDGNECVLCTAGKYSASSTIAVAGFDCEFCSAGFYQNTPGSSSCVQCEEGQLSLPHRTACGACKAGEFADTELQTCVTW